MTNETVKEVHKLIENISVEDGKINTSDLSKFVTLFGNLLEEGKKSLKNEKEDEEQDKRQLNDYNRIIVTINALRDSMKWNEYIKDDTTKHLMTLRFLYLAYFDIGVPVLFTILSDNKFFTTEERSKINKTITEIKSHFIDLFKWVQEPRYSSTTNSS